MNSSFPPPAKTRRAFEIICERIRQDLADGTLKPGDKLPPERELATQFGVSRPALREALRSLEQSGVLRNAKGARGGAFVQPAASGRIVQAMQDYVNLGSITLAELTEARIAIEDVIVRLACARASKADIDELERVALATREVTGVEARYEYAVLFYAVLARATRNRVFGVFVESLATILHQFVQGPGYEILQESLIRSRLRLVEALRSRDAETAAREMRNHLNRLHRHMRRNSAAARA